MNHFADGDIVECIQDHTGYGYKKGDLYTVRNTSSPGGYWTYVPAPNGSGLTCDGPICLKYFRLAALTLASSSSSATTSSPQPTPAPKTKFKVGDKIVFKGYGYTHSYASGWLNLGQTYEVESVNGGGNLHNIALVGVTSNLYLDDRDFDLVTAATAQTAAPSPNKTFKPGDRVEITPGNPLTCVKTGELGTIVRAGAGTYGTWWVQVDSTAREYPFCEAELTAHVPMTQVVAPEVFMGSSPSVKLIEPCEIVTSVANFKEFLYCRTHKKEPKDCPKC